MVKMGEVKDFVQLYVDDQKFAEKSAELLSAELPQNMKKNLWKGHGYDTGTLFDNIYGAYTTAFLNGDALVTGGYTVEHGLYVILGIRGKGKAKAGKIDFLSKGLERTIANYR